MKSRARPKVMNPAEKVMSRRDGLKLLTEINKATLKARDFSTYRMLRDRVLSMRNATLPALERVLYAQEVAITQKFERDTLYVRVASANKQKVQVVENAFKDFAVKHSFRTVLVEGLPVNPKSKRPHGLSETIATAVERMRAVVPSVLDRTPLKNQFYVGVQHGLIDLKEMMRTEEERELFAGQGAYFQNTIVVVVAREDQLPAFEVSVSTTNSLPFLELPYAHDPKAVQRLRNYRRNEAALDKFIAWHCAERGRDPTDMLTSRMLQRNNALHQAMSSALGALHVKADLRAQGVDTQTMLEKRKQKRQPRWLLKYARK